MRLVAGNPEVPECNGGESTAAIRDDGGEGGVGGAVVVVGVKLDSRSRELLTWALVKVAQSGDRVIALHVDLKLKVCKGSPVRKILFREVKSFGATSLILGTSGVHHKIRSRISVAKYCAKNLHKNISVICVDNGKIVFQRESNASTVSLFGSLDASKSALKRRKTSHESPMSPPFQRVISISGNGNANTSLALVPLKTQEMPESKSRWAALRRVLLHSRRTTETSSSKKSSIVQWMLRLPSQQSVAAIYPDQKQIAAPDRDKSHLDLDSEKGAIVPYSAEKNSVPYSSKTFSEELKDLGEKYSTTCQLFSYQELLLATNNFIPGVEKSEILFGSEERYKVALGVAEALNHIHNSAESIIHRDVKSSNILLSDAFEPQLSDFGLATWASSCSHHMDNSDVAGTFGYLAPEYFMHGKLNQKLDVYAFGVVLLELLSGRKPIDNESPKGQESLVMWVLKLLQGDSEVVEWARQETKTCEDFNVISSEQSATDIQSFINLALLNVEDDSASTSSTEQNISVEDYLKGRWSRSSSFD
ncbi:hypothetical protein DH2020_025756 [Rehmannia glutinosa]|uniref:Protein kinase domain-containing protein n=1 Tax=Rehmannia glutinosa TaxID=99300 RepID=A0ABR0W1K2_REHGL